MYQRLTLLVALSVFSHAVAGDQTPLLASHQSASSSYEFKWPIRKVAIIGAGPGGLVNYREFTRAGFDVHLFERDNAPGGNWHYTDETPLNAPVPNADIAVADFTPSLPPKGAKLPYVETYRGKKSDELLRAHRAPKPIWETLHSNAPAPIQQITELPWPKGTPWELPHANVRNYVRAFASFHGANANDENPRVSYNTRVELVEKRYTPEGKEAGWTLTLKEVVRTGVHSSKAIWTAEDFDAVVVATGRYNAPNIPNIPGLKEWAERFPEAITHSRQYRRPQGYANQTVLVVGAATSGSEISRDLNKHVKKTYQSIRPDKATRPHFVLDIFLRRLPQNVSVVPEIKRFLPPTSSISTSQVELANGTILTNLDSIIFSTGFRYTFPFLPQFHSSSPSRNTKHDSGSHPRPIITDGTHVRSLYLDVFYIEEPTLGFVDVNIGMQSFTYSEYIGVALSKVWSQKAHIPSTPELWRLQGERVEGEGGYGPHFQFLGADKTDKLIRFFLGWLNTAASRYGGRQIDGITLGNFDIASLWNKARFGSDIFQGVRDNATIAGIAGVDSDISILEADSIDLYNDSW